MIKRVQAWCAEEWVSALVILLMILWVVSLCMMVLSILYGGSDGWFYLFVFITIIFMAG